MSSSNDPRKWNLQDFQAVAAQLDASDATFNDEEVKFIANMLDARSITRNQKAWLVKLSNRKLGTRYKDLTFSVN